MAAKSTNSTIITVVFAIAILFGAWIVIPILAKKLGTGGSAGGSSTIPGSMSGSGYEDYYPPAESQQSNIAQALLQALQSLGKPAAKPTSASAFKDPLSPNSASATVSAGQGLLNELSGKNWFGTQTDKQEGQQMLDLGSDLSFADFKLLTGTPNFYDTAGIPLSQANVQEGLDLSGYNYTGPPAQWNQIAQDANAQLDLSGYDYTGQGVSYAPSTVDQSTASVSEDDSE